MPDAPASATSRDRTQALLIVCVLAVASIFVAPLGTAPGRVGATELLGDPRTPGEAAFIASHRGGGATAPENTLPAITAALAAGFDYVEVDVALTADRHPVLMHDATVHRTTDGHGAIASLTLEQVRVAKPCSHDRRWSMTSTLPGFGSSSTRSTATRSGRR